MGDLVKRLRFLDGSGCRTKEKLRLEAAYMIEKLQDRIGEAYQLAGGIVYDDANLVKLLDLLSKDD